MRIRTECLLSIFFFLFGLIRATEFDNRLRIGLDSRFVYQRQIAHGWWIGTDVKGETNGGGGALFSMNHEFSYWLLTLSKDLEWRGLHMDNTLKYFGSQKRFEQINFNLQFSKAIPLVDNVLFAPTFTAFDYIFDLDPDRKTLPAERAHNFSALWGLSLRFDYCF